MDLNRIPHKNGNTYKNTNELQQKREIKRKKRRIKDHFEMVQR